METHLAVDKVIIIAIIIIATIATIIVFAAATILPLAAILLLAAITVIIVVVIKIIVVIVVHFTVHNYTILLAVLLVVSLESDLRALLEAVHLGGSADLGECRAGGRGAGDESEGEGEDLHLDRVGSSTDCGEANEMLRDAIYETNQHRPRSLSWRECRGEVFMSPLFTSSLFTSFQKLRW